MNFRKDNLENENANLVKELDRIKAEHRTLMTKQASASDMLIKEYKYQNVILQNAVSASKSVIDINHAHNFRRLTKDKE